MRIQNFYRGSLVVKRGRILGERSSGEDIDKAKTGAVGFEGLALFVKNIGHDNVIADGLHVEGYEIAGKLFVHEGFVLASKAILVKAVAVGIVRFELYAVEGVVIDIDAALELCQLLGALHQLRAGV